VSQRWAMLLVIFFTRTSLGFQFQSIAALTPFLVTAFELSWAQVGLLMGLFMLPGVVFALPGGLLGQRFGSLRVVIAGLGLMIVGGMLVSYAGGLGSAALGRTLAGIGFLVTFFLEWHYSLSLLWTFVGLALSVGTGLLAGFYPAWRASRLDPIVALRYE